MMAGKMNRNHFRFSIRKLSIGAASVLLGLGFMGATNHNTQAASTRMSGIVRTTPVPNHPTWKILLWDGEGHGTGVYINPNTNYKVFEKKSMNGLEYYRLGTDKQWVQAQYVDATGATEEGTTSETKAIYTVGSNAVSLVDGQGNASGQVLSPGSTWKAFAKKTINGQTYYRLGTYQQWAPANGGVIEGSVIDEGSVSNQGQNFYNPSSDDDTSTPTTPTKPSQDLQSLVKDLQKDKDKNIIPDTSVNKSLTAEQFITARGGKLAKGQKAYWKETPDFSTTGEKNAVIYVDGKNGLEETLNAKLFVGDKPVSTDVESAVKDVRKDANGNPIADTKAGTPLTAEELIAKRGAKLPDGQSADWEEVPDFSKPGEHTAKIVINNVDKDGHKSFEKAISTKFYVEDSKTTPATPIDKFVAENKDSDAKPDDISVNKSASVADYATALRNATFLVDVLHSDTAKTVDDILKDNNANLAGYTGAVILVPADVAQTQEVWVYQKGNIDTPIKMNVNKLITVK
ncbi:MAG: YSIRK-type signal peptide-containing protein [Lactobacillus sp.]|nr:YSIRK-type signal peptide-containing protein [Lactobacillus sp.]